MVGERTGLEGKASRVHLVEVEREGCCGKKEQNVELCVVIRGTSRVVGALDVLWSVGCFTLRLLCTEGQVHS